MADVVTDRQEAGGGRAKIVTPPGFDPMIAREHGATAPHDIGSGEDHGLSI